jgi:putative ABC transport system permease protein
MIHEWLPSLCLALALASVFCPVVIILGLKQGVVENLRQSLLRDPANLELRPKSSLSVDEAFLVKTRDIPGVGFVIPKTRSLGLVAVQFRCGEKQADLDLVPTAAGDPVLGHYGVLPPEPLQAVLTYSAARALGLEMNEQAEIVMELRRYDSNGRLEQQVLPVGVTKVLPLSATTLRAAYVTLDLLAAVEQFRENLAVPWLKWSGGDSTAAEPVFDGFVVWGEKEFSPALESRMAVASHFLEQRRITRNDPDRQLARLAARHGFVTLYYNENDPYPVEMVYMAESLLAGQALGVSPWSKPRKLTVLDSLDRQYEVMLCAHVMEGNERIEQSKEPFVLPSLSARNFAPPVRINVPSLVGKLEIPIQIGGPGESFEERGQNILHGSTRLTGVLRHLDFRSLQWDEAGERFLLGRRNFSGLRLYARSLEDVQPLVEALRRDGIECSSAADRVERVLKFESDLTLLFLLVSAFSLTGGGAALALSMYGNIERRRRDYGMLRTLGSPKLLLGFLPVIEATFLSLGGFGIALGVFHGSAVVINRVFAAHNEEAGGFCQLPLAMQGMVGLAIMSLTLLCSAVAAFRVFSISPSEAIRHA